MQFNSVKQEPESLVRDYIGGKGYLEPEMDQDHSNCESALEITKAEPIAVCSDTCYSSDMKPFQPSDKAFLRNLTRKWP